jgi:hypothetical protein
MIDATEDRGILSEKYQSVISEENYKRLCILPSREWYLDYKDNLSKETYSFDNAKTKIILGKAETTCKYSYHRFDKNSKLSYEEHNEVIIYYKLKNGKWVVDDLYFHN